MLASSVCAQNKKEESTFLIGGGGGGGGCLLPVEGNQKMLIVHREGKSEDPIAIAKGRKWETVLSKGLK